MQNKNRKEARLEVVFREVEKLVICNSSRYLMTIRILVTMATCKANSNKDISFSLPEPPEKPEDRDCCGNGCTPCVFDIYEELVCKWRKECERIKSGETLGDSLQSADGDEILSTSEFHSFVLESVTRLTTDSCVYRFHVPKGKTLGLHIGQHLILRGSFQGMPISRQYTPVSSTESHGFFDVLIKVYSNGKMSSYIRSWQVGDMVEWRGPFGRFSYRPNKFRRIGMLAAGTGIAPMLQVIQGILANEDDETFIHLVYSSQRCADILMKDTLDEMKAFWNFSVLYIVTKESEADKSNVKYGDKVYYGRINQELVSREMPKPSADIQILICGTKSFDKDMINYLKISGYTPDMYFKF
ncbi:NADH-cytochrome b5 reductase-like [Acropora muricata]|uniref:NADH-cytochrome b5 reductase-like n=1 Tax=Acropora muricata TaxID=159855 RepID=UPI0034E575F5